MNIFSYGCQMNVAVAVAGAGAVDVWCLGERCVVWSRAENLGDG